MTKPGRRSIDGFGPRGRLQLRSRGRAAQIASDAATGAVRLIQTARGPQPAAVRGHAAAARLARESAVTAELANRRRPARQARVLFGLQPHRHRHRPGRRDVQWLGLLAACEVDPPRPSAARGSIRRRWLSMYPSSTSSRPPAPATLLRSTSASAKARQLRRVHHPFEVRSRTDRSAPGFAAHISHPSADRAKPSRSPSMSLASWIADERPGQLDPGAHPELPVDVAQMRFDGPGAEDELLRDLAVRAAGGDQAGDLMLALGEP